MMTKIHSWMSTPSSTSWRVHLSRRLSSGLSLHAAGKGTASLQSRIANFLGISSAELDSCRALLNGAHARLRAEVERGRGIEPPLIPDRDPLQQGQPQPWLASGSTKSLAPAPAAGFRLVIASATRPELVTPRRRPNGYRDFGEDDVRIVRELRSLRELGIVAERSRPFVECLASGAVESDDCPSSLAEYAAAIDELTVRITELTDRRAALVKRLRGGRVPKQLGTTCPGILQRYHLGSRLRRITP